MTRREAAFLLVGLGIGSTAMDWNGVTHSLAGIKADPMQLLLVIPPALVLTGSIILYRAKNTARNQ